MTISNPRFRILFAAAVMVALLPGFTAAKQNAGNKKSWYEQETVQQKLELTAVLGGSCKAQSL